jgi:pseudouridine kinase
MPSHSVLVAGGANIDVKVVSSGETSEGISTPGRIHVCPGGVARNIAEALARLGARSHLLTVVGDDPWGAWLIAQTASAGVETQAILRHSGQTGFYVTVNGRGIADTLIIEETPPEDWLGASVEDASLLVLDANLAEPVMAALARRAGRLALVGTSPAKVGRLRSLLDGAWLACLTVAEARTLAGQEGTEGTGEALARAVQALGPEHVLLTEGAEGLALLRGAGREWLTEAAHPAAVVDPTGAGDTAAALVTFALLEGWPVARILPLAAKAAALTVSGWGNVHPEVGTLLVEGRVR